MSRFVVISKYSFSLNARIDDEHIVNMQWLYSDAIRSVRLYVPEEFEVEAKAILALNFSEDVDSAFEETPEHCTQCQSTNLVNYIKGKKPVSILFNLNSG